MKTESAQATHSEQRRRRETKLGARRVKVFPTAETKTRVTYLVPQRLELNIAAYSLISRRAKNDLVIEALSEFLRAKGIEPFSTPIVSWDETPGSVPPDGQEANAAVPKPVNGS